jgi:hypothetical protein
MRWKKYSKEKPTNCEHEYLVKTKGLSDGTSYDIYYWADNLSEVDEYNFKNMEEDGFYYFDPDWGFLNIIAKEYELFWIDLTELDLELSNGKEMQ